jgi:rhodanese-related sulfurtransferase
MTQPLSKSAKDLVTEAKARVQNLTPAEVEEELRNTDTLLVDLREADEREQNGTIPGGLHVTRGMLEFRADPSTPYYNRELRPDRRVILYCAAGSRSALGAVALQEMGYTNVAHLDGGFKSWQEGGKAVSKE